MTKNAKRTMKKASINAIREAAHQIAGATVMCYLMQLPFDSVELNDDAGCVHHNDERIDRRFPKWQENPSCHLQKRMVHMCLAGSLSVAIYTYSLADVDQLLPEEIFGKQRLSGAMKAAKFWAQDAAGVSGDEIFERMDFLHFETLRLLFYPAVWRAIDGLAELLVDTPRMGERAAMSIIKRELPQPRKVLAECGVRFDDPCWIFWQGKQPMEPGSRKAGSRGFRKLLAEAFRAKAA